MQLRNAILIALAIDATPQEIEHAHDTIDRIFGTDGKGNGVAPEYLVNTSVPATGADGKTANGLQTTLVNPELDKTGLPWDERIHSSSKENRLNADGTWRAKRGVDKGYAAGIEAQLRATLSAPAATTVPPVQQSAPPVATVAATLSAPAATTVPPVQQSAPPVATVAATLPPMPGGNLPPMPGAAAVDPAYSALVQFIGANTQSTANPAGKFTDQYISDLLKHYGIADGQLPTLAHRLDLVPTVHQWLLTLV